MASKRDCDNAFQEYTILNTNVTAPIPAGVSYESVAVLPLCLSTAAVGLYLKGYLELPYPSLTPKPNGKTLLLWGGASAVGSIGIQLAVATGFEAIATASPKNFAYVKKLGASRAFDYNSPSVVDELVDALKGKALAGTLDCVGNDGALQNCCAVVEKCRGATTVSTVTRLPEGLPERIKVVRIFGIIKDDALARAVYEDFLPRARSEGKLCWRRSRLLLGRVLRLFRARLRLVRRVCLLGRVVITL